MKCPECGSTDIRVYYVDPVVYECGKCEVSLYDENVINAIPVLSVGQAKAKHPALYGLRACEDCGHQPHGNKWGCEAECYWCNPIRHKRNVVLRRSPRNKV